MGKTLLKHPRVYLVQNAMAACLFLSLLAAEGVAYLLHAFPSVEILWALSISANRIAGPFLGTADHLIGLPFALLAILALATVLPLASYRLRSWLGTAISGHVALGLFVMLTYGALRRAATGHIMANLSMASLANTFDPALLERPREQF